MSNQNLLLSPKEKVMKIYSIDGGDRVKKRLNEVGVIKGELIKVKEKMSGNVVVEVKGNKIAIGKGMAIKILVEEII